MQTQQAEVPIYQDGAVTITRTLVKVANKSYPINGIGSVDVRPPDRSKGVITGLVFIGFGIWWINSINNAGWVSIVLGGLVLLGSLSLPNHLVLRTASGDQQALDSRDKAYLSKIKAAIEQAVVMRG